MCNAQLIYSKVETHSRAAGRTNLTESNSGGGGCSKSQNNEIILACTFAPGQYRISTWCTEKHVLASLLCVDQVIIWQNSLINHETHTYVAA